MKRKLIAKKIETLPVQYGDVFLYWSVNPAQETQRSLWELDDYFIIQGNYGEETLYHVFLKATGVYIQELGWMTFEVEFEGQTPPQTPPQKPEPRPVIPGYDVLTTEEVQKTLDLAYPRVVTPCPDLKLVNRIYRIGPAATIEFVERCKQIQGPMFMGGIVLTKGYESLSYALLTEAEPKPNQDSIILETLAHPAGSPLSKAFVDASEFWRKLLSKV